MAEYAGEKTLDPTPHRRQQARREGHVAKSQELGSAAVLLAGIALLMVLGGGLAGFLADYCRTQLGGEPCLSISAEGVVDQWNATLWSLGRWMAPILGLLFLTGVAIHVLQVGFLFLPQRLGFDPTRLDPIRGLQRIFSGANLVRLGMGLLKLAILLGVASVVLYGQREEILSLSSLAPAPLAQQVTHILLNTALKLGAALLVLALLDYAYQWWRHEQDLKMTPQELREELQNLEGNPQVLARRKQMQRELAKK
ncbi:MAG: EscU/YscU/HrcU family type III secretion system export apparatus switch protein [Thermoguttaceae bacterium]